MRKPVLRFEPLEAISAPAVLTAAIDPAADNAGAVAEVAGLVTQANASAEADTIRLFPGSAYTFTAAADGSEGGTALPAVTGTPDKANDLTVDGRGATLRRADGPATFRFFRAAGKGAQLTLTDLTLTNGSVAGADGGAVKLTDGASLTATRVTFAGNAAVNGGAVDADQFGSPGFTPPITFDGCTFGDNKATKDGGAVHNRFGANYTFTGCTLTGNTAGDGAGGVGSFAGSFTFTGCTLSENEGTSAGAVNNVGTVSLTNCSVLANVATTGGTGGVSSFESVTVTGSTIADNLGKGSVGGGGGINSRSITVTNSTVHNNQAAGAGGLSAVLGTVTVAHSTVTNNHSRFGIPTGGGIECKTVTAIGSVIAGNTNDADPGESDITDVKADNFISQGMNLIGVAPAGFTKAAGDQTGSKDLPLDPRLGPLEANGGPTLTRLPLVGSPVLDAGTATPAAGVTTDQRGLARVRNGAFDIGAVEIQTGSETPARPPAELTGYPQFGAGADVGSGQVVFYNPDKSVRFSVEPFPGFAGGVRTAAADFNNDGVADLVVGTGPGRATRVLVLDGKSQAQMFSVDPFEASFVGGVYVAAGDVDGDGKADLVITPDEGGGPRCDVYSGNGFGKLASFFGIDDPNFRGGARSAIGDVNGDGAGDLVVAAGFQGGPRVAAFSGKSLGSGPVKLFNDFFAFEQTLRNGVFIATGDIDGDGKAEVIAGGGPGGGPRVTAFSATDLITSGGGTLTQLANFFGGNEANRGGVRVAVKDLDGDARADLVVGAGTGAGSRVTGYFGKNVAPAGTPAAAFDFDAFPGFAGGVFVG